MRMICIFSSNSLSRKWISVYPPKMTPPLIDTGGTAVRIVCLKWSLQLVALSPACPVNVCMRQLVRLNVALFSKLYAFLSLSPDMSTLLCLCTEWLPSLLLLLLLLLLSTLHAELLSAAWHLSLCPLVTCHCHCSRGVTVLWAHYSIR